MADIDQEMDEEYEAWSVTEEEAKSVGDRLGVDWERFPLEELRKGMEVEFEHQSDIVQCARIALDHLKESETYYTDLEQMEEAEKSKKEAVTKNQRILQAFLNR